MELRRRSKGFALLTHTNISGICKIGSWISWEIISFSQWKLETGIWLEAKILNFDLWRFLLVANLFYIPWGKFTKLIVQVRCMQKSNLTHNLWILIDRLHINEIRSFRCLLRFKLGSLTRQCHRPLMQSTHIAELLQYSIAAF